MVTDQSTVEVTCRDGEGYIVLDIEAENFTYPQTAVLKSRVSQLIDAGHRYFALNCEGINLVDSFGLATIVSVLKMTKECHGAIVLFNLNDFFIKLVEITHLDRVLEVWPSESQATYYLTTMMKP